MSTQRLIDRRRWMPMVFVEDCDYEGVIITSPATDQDVSSIADETRKILLAMVLNGMDETQRLRKAGALK